MTAAPPWCDAWACCRVPLPRPLRPTTGVAVETRLKRLAGLSRPSRPWLRRPVRQPLSRVRQARTYPAARPDPAAPRALRQSPARPDPRSAGPTGIPAASPIASSRAAPPDGARVPMAPSQARVVSCASRSGAPVEGVQDSDGGRSVRQYPGHCGPPRPQWAVLRQAARGRCPPLTSRHRWQHVFTTPAAPAAPPIPRRRLRAAAPRAVKARRACVRGVPGAGRRRAVLNYGEQLAQCTLVSASSLSRLAAIDPKRTMRMGNCNVRIRGRAKSSG